MDREMKQSLYQCSQKGLIELMNDPRYADKPAAQFNAVVGYLARFEMYGGKSKGEFMDLVNAAKNEFIAQAAKKHADSDQPLPYGQLGENDAKVKAFIRDPENTLKNEFVALATRKENLGNEDDPDVIEYYRRIKANAGMLSIQVGSAEFSSAHRPYNADLADVMGRLAKRMPEGMDGPEALKKANSGFFGTLFRRPSKEYKAFQEAFDEFRDSSHVHNSGNTENLEKKTTDYIKRHIPDFHYAKDMPKEQMLAALPKGVRARVGFAFDVLDSIHEHREMKPYMDNVDKAIHGKPVVEVPKQQAAPVEAENQKDFQKDVALAAQEPEVKVEEEAPEKSPNAIEAQNDLK